MKKILIAIVAVIVCLALYNKCADNKEDCDEVALQKRIDDLKRQLDAPAPTINVRVRHSALGPVVSAPERPTTCIEPVAPVTVTVAPPASIHNENPSRTSAEEILKLARAMRRKIILAETARDLAVVEAREHNTPERRQNITNIEKDLAYMRSELKKLDIEAKGFLRASLIQE